MFEKKMSFECQRKQERKKERENRKQEGRDETLTAGSIGRRTALRGLSCNTVALYNFICDVLRALTRAIMCLSVAVQL